MIHDYEINNAADCCEYVKGTATRKAFIAGAEWARDGSDNWKCGHPWGDCVVVGEYQSYGEDRYEILNYYYDGNRWMNAKNGRRESEPYRWLLLMHR